MFPSLRASVCESQETGEAYMNVSKPRGFGVLRGPTGRDCRRRGVGVR